MSGDDVVEGVAPIVLPVEDLLPAPGEHATPLWTRLSQGLENAISAGTLGPGSRLENEVDLSMRLGLSRPTVRRAIQDLVDKGLLVRRRGIGTQVVHGSVARRIELTSLFDDLKRAGKTPRTRILAFEVRPASTRVATQLGLEDGAPALRIRRLRLADETPIAVLENHLPAPYLDLARDSLDESGLYGQLKSRGVVLRVARQQIGARRATNEESRLLELGRGAPVLTMERTAYDAEGGAVEFGSHCYRPDLYSFEMTLVGR